MIALVEHVTRNVSRCTGPVILVTGYVELFSGETGGCPVIHPCILTLFNDMLPAILVSVFIAVLAFEPGICQTGRSRVVKAIDRETASFLVNGCLTAVIKAILSSIVFNDENKGSD